MLMPYLSNILMQSTSENFTPLSSVECTPSTRYPSSAGGVDFCGSFIISVSDMVSLLGMKKTLLDFLSLEMIYLESSGSPDPDVAPVS